MRRQHEQYIKRTLTRQKVMLGLVSLGFVALAVKLVVIQLVGHDKLVSEANARHIRLVETKAVRGPIYDRNDRILAVSTPVDTIGAVADLFCASSEEWGNMPKLLQLKKTNLLETCKQLEAHEFKRNYMFIKRQIAPLLASRVDALKIPGVRLERDYKRFYPSGPAAGHLIGFTSVDGLGQEGLEKAYDGSLRGSKGKQMVHRDSKGRFVEYVEQVKAVDNGQAMHLSIDSRLQYLASGYLEQAVRQHKAQGGSAVLLYAPTGEILAMVDSPQFNPNDRRTFLPNLFRNRAVTDVQEPGSTVKPFTVATALESGEFTPNSTIDTGEKPFRIPGGRISDTHPNGVLSIEDIVVKSSNIGAAKLLMELPYENFWETLDKVGFGHKVNAVPAEVSGVLPRRSRLIDRVTQSYGYGLNATPLQIARAYTLFANDGILKPLTILKQAPETKVHGARVFSDETTQQVLEMLERVTSDEGTARNARVQRYRVGGKTGTSRRNTGNGYEKGRYVSWFVGLAPISDPKFVMAVMVDDPSDGKYYGGTVAAPVFSKTMSDALRLYNIAPDRLEGSEDDGAKFAAAKSRKSGERT